MYFANMYCYGFDNNTVGITGIRGCIGVVYAGSGAMYAVHIPPQSDQEQTEAADVFARWVRNQEGNVGNGHGHLFVFVNGGNRPTVAAEAKHVKKALKSPPTTVVRLMKHLGSNSGGLDAMAAVIMVERVHASPTAPSGCIAWYKQNDLIQWVNGGRAESGQYGKPRPHFCGAEVPSDLEAHWWRADHPNATSTII